MSDRSGTCSSNRKKRWGPKRRKCSEDESSYFTKQVVDDYKVESNGCEERKEEESKNIVQEYLNYQMSRQKQFSGLNRSSRKVVVQALSQFRLSNRSAALDSRLMAMDWHPVYTKSVVFGSKKGDVLKLDFDKTRNATQTLLQGDGAGTAITAMKFDQLDPNLVYTGGQDSCVLVHNFERKMHETLLSLSQYKYQRWYTALDIQQDNKMLAAGDNAGYVHFLLTTGDKKDAMIHQLHKQKISYLEFSHQDQNLMVTASVDRTARLWDLRMMKGGAEPLFTLAHTKPINSACFSLQNGTRLLTTDQKWQLRIYRGPEWNLERVIPHPHRQFQHLTAIKASWHPLQDIVVVGRYPDPKAPGYVRGELRSIDFFDAETGSTLLQFSHPGSNGIVSLNRFNKTGDFLGCAMGYTVLIWRREFSTKGMFNPCGKACNKKYSDDEHDEEFKTNEVKQNVRQMKLTCKKIL